MMNRVLLLMLLACSGLTAAAQNTLVDSMLWQGSWHRFRVYEPAVKKCALVVHLHGYGSNSFLEQIYTGYMPVADTAGFVVVYPDGLVDPLGNQSWNVGWPLQIPNDDVGFLSAFIDTMTSRYSLNPAAVFVSGISNGGFMAHRLACEISPKIAAIASVSGGMTSQLYNSCAPATAVPVMEIHGTQDATIPFAGTLNPSSVNIDSVIKRCAELAGCDPVPQITSLPHHPNTVNGTSVIRYVYSGGPNEATCELYKIIGGEHVNWPGFDHSTNNDFSAAKEIWRFFSSYRNCSTLQTFQATQTTAAVQVYPNPSSTIFNVTLPPGRFTSYDITDVTGRVVHNNIKNDLQLLRIDMKDLPEGLYLLRLKGSEEHAVYRLLLQH